MFRVVAFALLAAPLGTAAGELSVDDFCFQGPLGSRGAAIEKLGPEHFKVNLARVPEKPEWSNMLQFTLLRNAKGKRLRLDGAGPGLRAFCSWSYDGKNWNPIRLTTVRDGSQEVRTLMFPEFTEDRVYVGGEVPMSYEDLVEMVARWEKHPHATVHVLGESLGGRKIYRVTVTDPDSPHPPKARWAHHAVNQHTYEYNAKWRIVGMIEWMLSDEGADCRRRHIGHFVVMMNVDGPANGYARVNSQGIDMNRSYSADGTDPDKQAHEAYLVQKDLEGIMASESPVSLCWSMHTWAGEKVEPLLRPGADMGTTLGPWTDLRDIIARHDTRNNFKPLVVLTSSLQPTHWTSGTHKQFGVSAICCEGAANLYTKEENLHTGKVLMQSVAEYYRGTKP